MSPGLSHLDEHGHAFMVDVTGKPSTARRATVRCVITNAANSLAQLAGDPAPLEEARFAGLGAAKQTAQLIPLCHPLPLDELDVAFVLGEEVIEVHAHAATHSQTGVEMEALTACAVAAVSLLGACRPRDPLATMEGLAVWEKRGGRSGTWTRREDGTTEHHGVGVDSPAGGSLAR